MGYYTDYTIVKAPPAAVEQLHSISVYTWENEDELFGVKWYSWSNDLALVSKSFPLHTLVIDGVGEEYPDIWRAYAKNGVVIKVQADVTFKEPTFDKD